MLCSNHHKNVEGAFFCEICGEVLSQSLASLPHLRLCPECGTPNAPETAQCRVCGYGLPLATNMRAARLVVVQDGTIFPLETTRETTVGRADPTSQSYPDVDLTPHGGDDGGVSRIHLRIRFAQGKFLVEDQKSINLTFLNKQRLEPFIPTSLKPGDELRMGRVLLRFENGEE